MLWLHFFVDLVFHCFHVSPQGFLVVPVVGEWESERASIIRVVHLNYIQLPIQSVLGGKWFVKLMHSHSMLSLMKGQLLDEQYYLQLQVYLTHWDFCLPTYRSGREYFKRCANVVWDGMNLFHLSWNLNGKHGSKAWSIFNSEIKFNLGVVPKDMTIIQKIELTHFSDAYRQCSYCSIVSDEQVYHALVMGKAWVAPVQGCQHTTSWAYCSYSFFTIFFCVCLFVGSLCVHFWSKVLFSAFFKVSVHNISWYFK